MIYSILHFMYQINYMLLQIPQGVPHPDDNEPLTLESPFDIILYVVIPIIILGSYFWWRKKKKKK